MIAITRRVLQVLYDDCPPLRASWFPAYSFDLRGNARPGFEKLDARQLDKKIVRLIMTEITDLQNEGYDICKLYRDLPLLDQIAANVKDDLAKTLKIEVPNGPMFELIEK